MFTADSCLGRVNGRAGWLVPWALMLALWSGTASAASPVAAEHLIRQITDELTAAFAAQRQAIREDPSRAYYLVDEIASRHTDYQRIARLALGKQWRRASEEQRRRFVGEFRSMLLRTYAAALTEHSGATVTYHQSRVSKSAETVLVRTQVPRGPDASLRVDYRMGLRDGRWMVYDVVVEGVSLVSTYRSHFASAVRRRGIDAVIEHLAAANRDGGER